MTNTSKNHLKHRPGRTLLSGFVGVGLALLPAVRGAHADEPVVTVMPGKPALMLGNFDLNTFDYTTAEFSVAGTATAYKVAGEASIDGHWNAVPDGTAPFATRIVVIRPHDAHKFNGTVVVEWMNVSGGLDVPVDWSTVHRELLRGGYAYVGVSAQKVGVEGGPSVNGSPARPLKTVDPARYGRLSHPGDAFSFDIYSQTGGLLKGRQVSKLLGPLQVKRVIAMGESQSAFFLGAYVNAVDPLARVYDGIVIHSRSGIVASLDGSSIIGAPPERMREAVRLRSDLRVPVMEVITETDLMGLAGSIGFHAARQPDTNRLRIWEISGTAHADNYLFAVGAIDSGSIPIEQLAAAWAPMHVLRGMQLEKPMNNAPQHHYVTEAALWQMDRWLRTGRAPPKAQPLTLTADQPPKLALDVNGNALGGIRTPWVDVPTERLAGVGGSPQAQLVGFSEPLDKPALDHLYPAGRSEYLRKFAASLDMTIKAGYILPADRQEILDLARASYQGSN